MIVFLAALLSACVLPTDTSGIMVGATRAPVEGVLGKPVKSTQTDSWRIDTYKYNRGAMYTGGGPLPLVILAAPIIQGIAYASQRRDIEVAYGPDDTVIYYGSAGIEEVLTFEAEAGHTYDIGPFWIKDTTTGKIVFDLEKFKEREKLVVAAEKGDREAQFQLYRVSRPSGKSLRWLCLAANQGYALAQEEFGDLHAGVYGGDWSDAGFAEPDRVRAYMWYSLAASSGHRRAGFTRNYLGKQMTPAQITEAERLAAEWKPGDCGAPAKSASAD